ncbi:hypothetical protein J4216_03040 [Candidatus Woesearchaeota archaeon]|nr:hypothetical protein [Candidatus Woesearchaeota archaeon]
MSYWLIFSVLLGGVSFFSHIFVNKFKEHKDWTVSLAVGVLVSYLFLQVFPEIYNRASVFGETIFLGVLIGFSIFYLAEKFMYRYLKHELIESLEILHLIIFFIYHLVIGVLLVSFFEINFLNGFVFFFSLAFLNLTSSAVFEVLHERKKRNRVVERIILSLGFIIGAFIAKFFILNSFLFGILLSFVGGVLIYIIGREVLPKENQGNPYFFIIGVLIYSILLTYLNTFNLM